MKISASIRSLKPSATIAAAAKAKELKNKGVKVYEFTLGEPDFTTPQHIQDAAIAAMKAGHTHYTPSGGIAELKQAICSAYERDHGLQYQPSEVLVSPPPANRATKLSSPPPTGSATAPWSN